MQNRIIFILALMPVLTVGQIDSAIYHKLANDSSIIHLSYVQMLYANRKVQAEGWMLKKEDSDPLRREWGAKYDRLPIIISRVGTWNLYRRNGRLKDVMNIPSIGEERFQKHYNGKGRLMYELFFPASAEYGAKLKKKFSKKKLKTYEKVAYDKEGRLLFEENWKNKKRCGIWKYYREGQLVREAHYSDNGKLTQKTKTKKLQQIE